MWTCAACSMCCEARKSRYDGSYPGRGVQKRGTGGHAWGCTQERRHSPGAGTGCQGAPASVGARLLTRGLAAASSPRCVRLSGQECRHDHTSHCHTIDLHIRRTAHGLWHKDVWHHFMRWHYCPRPDCAGATAWRTLRPQWLLTGAKSTRSVSQSSPPPAEHAQTGLRASAGGAGLQAGGLHGSPSQSCTASGPSRGCLDGCAGCAALHAPALLCCVPAQLRLAPVHVQTV